MTDERPFKASSRKIRDAKKHGNQPRSAELNTFFITLGGVIALLLLYQPIIHSLSTIMRSAFSSHSLNNKNIVLILQSSIRKICWVFIALGITSTVLTLLGPVLMGGFQFNVTLMQPKWQRVRFSQGIQRLFSPNNSIEIVKIMIKFTAILTASGCALWFRFHDVSRLSTLPVETGLRHSLWIIIMVVLTLLCCLAVFALLDAPFQLWRYQQSLRMSAQELKEERKATDGNPQTKQRLRKQQLEVANNRMILEVPKATVIITSHLGHAIAIRYDEGSELAPKLVAKGIGNIAEHIRYHALANQVPQISAPELAKSLYFHAPLYREIPAGLFNAIAKILAYSSDLTRYQQQRGPEPNVPNELEIPESLQVQ